MYVKRDVWPVSAADARGLQGTARYASTADTTSTSTIHITLPSGLTTRTNAGKNGNGPRLIIKGVGCSLQLHFSRGDVDVVWNQAAALGTGHVGAGGTVGDGQELDREIPRDVDRLNVLCSAASQFFEIRVIESGLG